MSSSIGPFMMMMWWWWCRCRLLLLFGPSSGPAPDAVAPGKLMTELNLANNRLSGE